MIDDQDILDLLIWVAYHRHLTIVWRDDSGIRRRRALWTMLYITFGMWLGYRSAGPLGALLGATVATMFAAENTWSGGVEEAHSLAEYLLYSDELRPRHRKELITAVRHAVVHYESAEFALLSELVGGHPLLQDRVVRAVADYVGEALCREVVSLPEAVH